MSAQDAAGLVERVARALMDRQLWPGAWDAASFGNADAERDVWRHLARAALAEMAATITPDPDSGRLVAVDALDSNGAQLRLLGAEDMATACEAGAALLRALAAMKEEHDAE